MGELRSGAQRRPRSVTRRAVGYLRPYVGRLVAGQIAMLVSTLAGLAFPLLARELVDALVLTSDTRTLFLTVGLMGGAMVLMAVAGFARERTLGVAGQRVVRDLRGEVFAKLQRLTLGYHSRRPSGDLISVMSNDVALVQSTLTSGVVTLVSHLVGLVGVVVMLLRLDPRLSLVTAAVVPTAVLVSRSMGRQSREISSRTQTLLGRVTAVVSESLAGIEVIKGFVLERLAIRMFGNENEEATRYAVASIRVRARNGLWLGIITAIFVVAVAGLGSLHVAKGMITPGDLVAFLVYAQMVAAPVGMLSTLYVDIQKAVAAGHRIFAVLDAPDEEHLPEVQGIPEVDGRIEFRNVGFGYDSDVPVLRGLTFSVDPGQTVALVGPSGAGKTTVLKLLMRFYDYTSGAILLDGKPLHGLPVSEVRSHMGMVMQDTHLFDLSVADNILCGDPDASEQEVRRAARLAAAHDFIEQLSDGYRTSLGENGTRLSGGQRQRIALARAILSDPRILLLDEATSALDTESERKIQAALRRVCRHRTTFIVAHRLSTIQDADRIFVLNEGSIEASGSHRELLRASELYWDLCEHQLIRG